jgi:hypothetical protein
MEKIMETKKRKKTTWGRGLSKSFVRKGTHRLIEIFDNRKDAGNTSRVFIAYSKDGSLNVQVYSNVGTVDKKWKSVFSENIPKSRRI